MLLAFGASPADAQTEPQQELSPAQQQPSATNGLTQADPLDERQAQPPTADEQCQVVQQDFEQRIAENSELRASFDASLVRDLREMRDTAMQLERYGRIEACNAVAAAIRQIVENPGQFTQPQASDGEPQGQNAGNNTDMASANGAEPAWDARVAHDVAQTVPIAEIGDGIRVEEMIGSDVRGAGGELIGEVDDVVLSGSGEPAYAIVAYGGFLGLGEELTAVPFDRLRISQDLDVLYLPMQQADLEQAPTFERDDYSWMQDQEWRQVNEEFYAGG